ncbi:ATP synthase subunit I (plasmid) [Azospirillum humicireducens]|uniref:ATP synthase subunit I n=1 Tax=Azospirillum humicireducens TaxID=1226968 RepID=A0A2R4VWV0_9PROT|nr:ATP synthase subunit I [Azospirillum humicireducens]AWB08930.1 ATP synthase subunit I [Azospirillum humicireducens]
MTAPYLLPILAGTLAGLVLGTLFFRGLAATARLYVSGGVRRAVPLYLLRLACATAGFTLAALWGGAEALLAMLAGFQLARSLVVRREKRAEAGRP